MPGTTAAASKMKQEAVGDGCGTGCGKLRCWRRSHGDSGVRQALDGQLARLKDWASKSKLATPGLASLRSASTSPAGGEEGASALVDRSAAKHVATAASVMQGVMEAIGAVAVDCASAEVGDGGDDARGGPSQSVKLRSQWRVRGTRSHPFRLHDGTWVIPALLRR